MCSPCWQSRRASQTLLSAIDANVERGKHLSAANNLWGRCVTNPSESANRVAKLSGGPGRASVELGDNSRTPNQRLIQTPRPELIDVNAPLAAIERQNTSAWSSVVTFFLEGFALYAASHCGLPPATLMSSTEFRPAEPCAPQRKVPARERSKSIYLISSSASPEAMASEHESRTDGTSLGSTMSSRMTSLATA
jgi:hypothetical protein